MTFVIEPGSLLLPFNSARARLRDGRIAEALWERRLDIWAGGAEARAVIANRLGWLDAPARAGADIARLRACADSVVGSGFSDIVLLGMGGSSLAPEVLRAIVGVAPGRPRFTVLDSVDPDAVRSAMARPATTLFVLASKSGSTIEPNTLAAEAARRLRDAGVSDPGSQFIAITDDGTALHRRALDEHFRDIFLNPADIGGRYSALSLFGLVPAALMGIDLDRLVASGRDMAAACRDEDPDRNPGLALGAFMAAAVTAGRDKLTLSVPPRLEPLGLWIEQLVAESTGKQGTGVVPIAGESDRLLGPDRAVVSIALPTEAPPQQGLSDARADGVPIVALSVPDVLHLGAEFFRWEMATAVAGYLLGVNPFDEPNVQEAKTATRGLLDLYTTSRRLPLPEPDAVIDHVRLTLSEPARHALAAEGPLAVLQLLRPGDYLGILAYLPPTGNGFGPAIEALRARGARRGCATTFGYGPRYLHSTGQLHKGGPDSGVFIVITAEASEDLPVPGEPYSFGVLERAQAAGDFASLARAGRRALQIHLPTRDPAVLEQIVGSLL